MTKKALENVLSFMKEGRVYRTRELVGLSSNLARDLEKLVEEKKIIKVASGLYYKSVETSLGKRPAEVEELVRAFLGTNDFLISSLNEYNQLGLGLTQLYNIRIVYNRKRHGKFTLDGRKFYFKRPIDYPKKLSIEFLYVDLLNNRSELAEDTTRLEKLLLQKVKNLDSRELLQNAYKYGKVATKKFFENVLS
jgi:hypothetical protein